MPALPWRTFRPPRREDEYLVLLSELPLKSYRALPRFLRFVVQITRQLASAPGLIGYSLFARLGSKQFWTLSVWEDEDALMAFVNAAPHRTVMRALQPNMGETQFIRWAIRGDSYPPMWNEAIARATSPPFNGMPP
jgi:heme-degrading monooxygenase HmoA